MKEDKPKRKSSAGSMSPGQNSPPPIMNDPASAAAAAAAAAAATNLQNLQAFLAASAAFPGLLSHGGAAAGLLAGLPGGLQSALAMQGLQGLQGLQGFQGLFGSMPAAAAATKHSSSVMSPPAGTTPSPGAGRNTDGSSIIDFSSKRPNHNIKVEKETDIEASGATPPPVRRRAGGESTPLDLSAGVRKRDRSSSGSTGPAEKRRSESGWKAGSSQETWNGHHKLGGGADAALKNAFAAPPDASKALERMTELSRLSGESRSGAGGGRQSAWQSHWLSKGADTAKDVLKCVWCKLSFETLAALTTHMKESKHCGVNASLMSSASSASGAAGSVNSSPVASSPSSHNQPQASPSSHQSDRSLTASHPATSSSSTAPSGGGGRAHHSSNSGSTNHDLLLKESGQVQLPRKLVRGQDVWLGKGAEQTRQILKCMWCGQSFRSLAEMTTHMQQTQHYTNIISQEQIISWKAADGEGGGGGGGATSKSSSGGGGGGSSNHAHHPHGPAHQHGPPPTAPTAQQQQNQSHVNAVLTCKVCDQAFASLKELSSHMVKNSHYKEHIMRSISESGGRRRQARDKRKKALPVRKLLELERAQQEARSLTQQKDLAAHHHLEAMQKGSPPATGRINCEKCGDKIETSGFVEHIRQCVGNGQPMRAGSKSSTPSPSSMSTVKEAVSNGGRKTPKSKQTNPSPRASPMSVGSANGSDVPTSTAATSTPTKTDGNPSVLNAIEKLIEKSFDAGQGGSKQGGKAATAANPTGSNILRRLGIDEGMDYSKPLMDPLMTVNMLRLYGYGQAVGGHQRERTTSEASSSNASAVASNGDQSCREQPQQRDSGKSTPRSMNGSGSPLRSRSPSQSPSGINRRRRKDPSPTPAASPTMMEAEGNPSSPAPSSVSERSLRSATPATQISSPDGGAAGRRSQSQTPTDGQPVRSSLNALSSMFEGLTSTPAAAPSSSGNATGGFNPLAALQKLCDKTETNSPSSSGRPNSLGGAGSSNAGGSSGSNGGASGGSGSSVASTATNPGAILAFSWACNDAVMTDSIMKCAFCDTQFISKGAYRHHLSKMHFVKDAAGGTTPTLKASSSSTSASSSTANKVSSSSANSATNSATSTAASPQPPSGGGANTFENESPHSKFLKYTELAKQLSSKYV